jgi:hypothetical protein
MKRIFILGFVVAVGLSACAPERNPQADITSSGQVCAGSLDGQYCKNPQGKLISGPEVAADYEF